MNKIFDILIIGGGPTGLTLATLFSKNKNCKILLIDKNKTLGGCHRVDRTTEQGFFTEHGPRVYSSAFINFKSILKEINTSFNDLFTKYNFDIAKIGSTGFSKFTTNEKLKFITSYFIFTINNSYYSKITVKDFSKDMSESSKDYLDRLCRLTDGADASRYTMDKFFSLINDNGFYKLYQPKTANDKGLFYVWEKHLLEQKNVEIMKETKLLKVLPDKSTIYILSKDKAIPTKIQFNKLFLAIPPKNIQQIKANHLFDNMSIENVKETTYNNYISMTFFWEEKLDINLEHGFPKNEWGIIYVVLSDYMSFGKFKTVISACITILDKKSKTMSKSPLKCNKKELKDETLRQIKSDIKYPDHTLLHKEQDLSQKNEYMSEDTAFINTTKISSFKPQSTNYTNIYNVGTQNGLAYYNFTTIETAVSNAISVYNKVISNNQDYESFRLKRNSKVNDLLYSIGALIAMIAIIN